MANNNTGRKRYSRMTGWLAAFALMFAAAGPVRGAVLNTCTDCHGMPPRDAARKANPHFRSQSSAVVGNHQTHVKSAPAPADCNICHAPVSASAFSHQNNVINMANSIKGYSSATLRARYNKGTFFNQTSVPALASATCSNVNCHFERVTPAWNAAIGATPCALCHDASPVTLSHPKHIAITACATCHSDHSVEAKPYAHATSAGRAIAVTVGSYAGSNNRYLPSQATGRVAGSCTTAYCHSSVQSATGGAPPAYRTVTWGSAAMTCASCHGNTAATLTSGSHAAHLNAAYGFVCGDCHGAAGLGNTASHANQTINIDLTLNRGLSAAYSGDGIPQNSNFGLCSNTNCHGKNSGVWGSTASTTLCTKCHGQANFAYANFSAAQIAPGGTGVDTGGNSAASSPRVGAHQGHLLGQLGLSGPIRCGECHIKPTAVQDASHLNYTTATVTFSGRAVAAGHTPGVTRVSGLINCNNTYCHTGNRVGATATFTTPVWNNTALLGNTSIADTCTNKCHGMPPGSGVVGDTHQTYAVVNTIAGLSTCSSQSPATGCHPDINAAPTTMLNIWFDKLLHINGAVDGGSCVGCHSKAITRTKGRPGKTLAAVSTEFGLAWGHKKTGRGAVTDADCIVCHLEGDSATGKPSAIYHQDGNIDLRDPDGAGETAITNISGTAFTFQRFSTSYAAGSRTSTGHTSNTDIANVITQKFCLACHDSNGATNTAARTAGGTAFMPWGGVNLGANYTVANGAAAAGGVVDVKTQLAVTNSSAHPVLGPKNRDFPTAVRLNVPYKPTGTRGTSGTLSAGVVLNCFDCHNVTGSSPLTLRSVSAHGNAVTIRGTATVTGTPSAANAVTLCVVCHASYQTGNNHGAGSAFSSSTDGGMTAYVSFGCNICHSSGYTTAVVRPVRAQDTHGVNVLPTTGITKTGRWSGASTGTPAVVNARPYAFIRNTQVLPNHAPKKIGATTYSTTCMGGNVSPCSQGTQSYTVGGSF